MPGTPHDRAPEAYANNGHLNVYPSNFFQRRHHQKDIAERKIDDEVHGFAS